MKYLYILALVFSSLSFSEDGCDQHLEAYSDVHGGLPGGLIDEESHTVVSPVVEDHIWNESPTDLDETDSSGGGWAEAQTGGNRIVFRTDGGHILPPMNY